MIAGHELDTMAMRVIRGDYGNGRIRTTRLAGDGFEPDEIRDIQTRVNEILPDYQANPENYADLIREINGEEQAASGVEVDQRADNFLTQEQKDFMERYENEYVNKDFRDPDYRGPAAKETRERYEQLKKIRDDIEKTQVQEANNKLATDIARSNNEVNRALVDEVKKALDFVKEDKTGFDKTADAEKAMKIAAKGMSGQSISHSDLDELGKSADKIHSVDMAKNIVDNLKEAVVEDVEGAADKVKDVIEAVAETPKKVVETGKEVAELAEQIKEDYSVKAAETIKNITEFNKIPTEIMGQKGPDYKLAPEIIKNKIDDLQLSVKEMAYGGILPTDIAEGLLNILNFDKNNNVDVVLAKTEKESLDALKAGYEETTEKLHRLEKETGLSQKSTIEDIKKSFQESAKSIKGYSHLGNNAIINVFNKIKDALQNMKVKFAINKDTREIVDQYKTIWQQNNAAIVTGIAASKKQLKKLEKELKKTEQQLSKTIKDPKFLAALSKSGQKKYTEKYIEKESEITSLRDSISKLKQGIDVRTKAFEEHVNEQKEYLKERIEKREEYGLSSSRGLNNAIKNVDKYINKAQKMKDDYDR